MNQSNNLTIENEKSNLKTIDKKPRINHNKTKIFYCFLFFVIIIFFSFYSIMLLKLINENQKLITERERLIIESQKFINETKNLSNEKEFFKKFSYINELSFYSLLCPKEVFGKKKILVGDYGDGGYILLNDFKDIKIAYSLGISNIISFDKALADKGIDVYMYDHTINNLPFNNTKFHWKKIGVTSESKKTENMKSLKELIIENNHWKENNMILKIDIEHSEWDILNDISEDILNKFKYILLELHLVDLKKYGLYYNSLKKLIKNHQIFHIHCCNCGGLFIIGDNPICNVIEISLIIRKGNKFKKNNSSYPIKGFDFKTCPDRESLDKESIILNYCDNDYN